MYNIALLLICSTSNRPESDRNKYKDGFLLKEATVSHAKNTTCETVEIRQSVGVKCFTSLMRLLLWYVFCAICRL